jgi:hypothetical protein
MLALACASLSLQTSCNQGRPPIDARSTADVIAFVERTEIAKARDSMGQLDTAPYLLDRHWFSGGMVVDRVRARSRIIDALPSYLVVSAPRSPLITISRQEDVGRLLAYWWPTSGEELLRFCELVSARLLEKDEIVSDVVAVRTAFRVPKGVYVSDDSLLRILTAPEWIRFTETEATVKSWLIDEVGASLATCVLFRDGGGSVRFNLLSERKLTGIIHWQATN